VLVIKERLRKRVTESLILILVYLDEWRRSSSRWLLLSLGWKGKREISKDKVPCTRMAAAVVGAQQDRVAWLLFISNGSWLEYILPCRSTPPYSTPFSGASSWRCALEKSGDARTGSANLADFLWEKWRLSSTFSPLDELWGWVAARIGNMCYRNT